MAAGPRAFLGVAGAAAVLGPLAASVLALLGATAADAGETPNRGREIPHPARAGSIAVFPEGPPARLTGGFGEDSCHACHWEFEENPGAGELRISGFPDRYEAGQTYGLHIELEDSHLVVAGFQLAVRHSGDTTQAGELAVPSSEDHRVEVITERDIQFAQHRLDGIEPYGEGVAGWSVRWTAPFSDARVLLHASAVSGDGDQSQMGDRVFTVELEARPAR